MAVDLENDSNRAVVEWKDQLENRSASAGVTRVMFMKLLDI